MKRRGPGYKFDTMFDEECNSIRLCHNEHHTLGIYHVLEETRCAFIAAEYDTCVLKFLKATRHDEPINAEEETHRRKTAAYKDEADATLEEIKGTVFILLL